jgi:hypothetical protein
MAHFAKIENDIVTSVIVVSNDDCGGGDFPESEPIGQAFIASLGLNGLWLQTSYHANFRGCYASVGWTFDADLNEFIAAVYVEPIEPIDES